MLKCLNGCVNIGVGVVRSVGPEHCWTSSLDLWEWSGSSAEHRSIYFRTYPLATYTKGLQALHCDISSSYCLRQLIVHISAKTTIHTALILSEYLCYTPGYCTSPFDSPHVPVTAAINENRPSLNSMKLDLRCMVRSINSCSPETAPLQ